ncbi:MAG: hypothetical protein J6Y14_04860 [Fibrobacter sp.]|nr:hypothetical protein [Fibrobacter sp.]
MKFFVALFAFLFALFPLTDTDIWWHLACAREWVVTWSPVREGLPNIHEYFQQVVYAVYCIGGAPLLVVFKALLWGSVFALFLYPAGLRSRAKPIVVAVAVFYLFVLRFQLEMRPVVFTLLFLGVYWNVVPWLLARFASGDKHATDRVKTCLATIALLLLQWLWCKFQGLYILGPLFALLCLAHALYKNRPVQRKFQMVAPIVFVTLLFAMPLLHGEGVRLFLYPFGLLDRLLGLSPSAAIFASEIAENRSPITLLMAGENLLASAFMLAVVFFSLAYSLVNLFKYRRDSVLNVSLFVTSILALVAERNFVLLFPLFNAVLCSPRQEILRLPDFAAMGLVVRVSPFVVVACLLGFWAKSLAAYDKHMVAYQRVPVGAAAWMKAHPHEGRLFNDDRAGGYLAFMNPSDSIYIDGRFILKTADFFERYLRYSAEPSLFLSDADSLGVDRALFPLRFYARWGGVVKALEKSPDWSTAYVDAYFIVFARK